MFTVGEFSRLAQVSRRLLRYYDEVGLLNPAHIDPLTGYRYYNAEQLAHLNRILVLKDLGLSLAQIRGTMQTTLSAEEMQGMLLLKKSEIERRLQNDLRRIRNIEARLQSIRDTEADRPLNVVIKEIPALSTMSVRVQVDSFESGLRIFGQIRMMLPKLEHFGHCFCICRSNERTTRGMELELGCIVEAKMHDLIPLKNGLQLAFHELPAIPLMATFVAVGALDKIHAGYSGLAMWADNHGYRPAGTPREITLQVPQNADGSDLVTEVQFPVELIH